MRRNFADAVLGDKETVATYVAQQLLNWDKDPSDPHQPLDENGTFGPKTHEAVRRFQRAHPPLVVDGIVGPRTFEELGLVTNKSHAVKLHAQTRGGMCWAAAAAMLRGGKEPSPGSARTEKRGSLVATDDNVRAFGRDQHWDYLSCHSKIELLAQRLERAPLWLGGESVSARGTADSIHAVILAGLYVYYAGMPRCVMKIYDPWPIGRGRIYFMQWESPRLPGGNTFSTRWILAPQTWRP